MDNKLIVGIGEALWDVLPEGKKLGGAPANFASHVSQFGLDSCVVSAIGADRLGEETIEQLNDRDVKRHI
ncbi:MAG: carbohydrate kinase, partial [Muribaculaceae bacterium]|nr:carbohydrate kinase [Muribaculaceae bacterium]